MTRLTKQADVYLDEDHCIRTPWDWWWELQETGERVHIADEELDATDSTPNRDP